MDTTPRTPSTTRARGRLLPALAVVALALTGSAAQPALATAAPAAAPAAATATGAGMFTSLTPARLLDTRTGRGAPAAKVAPMATLRLQVTGRGGVPSSGVAAVALNVTVTKPSRGGHITVFPDGSSLPTASNVNFRAWQTVPNLVVVPVGAGGKVDLHNYSYGTTHLVADVAGFYSSGTPTDPGAFRSLGPERLLDTRTGDGAPAAPLGSRATMTLQVAGRGGVPDTGVSAVVLNVTVTEPVKGGHLTVYRDGASVPTASNLNFEAGETVPNLVLAPLGTNGRVALTNGSYGSVHVVADIAGYVLGGTAADAGALQSLGPVRLLDTRVGKGAPKAKVRSGATLRLQVGGRGGVPSSGVAAVVMNVTVTRPTGYGYITAHADGTARPTASNLNFVRGQTVPNLVIAPVAPNGKVALYNGSSGSTDLVADVAGYVIAPDTVGTVCTNPYFRTSNSNGGITDGGYYVHNNLWNAAAYPGTKGTTEVCSYRSWNHTATASNSNGDGGVKTYPNVHKDYSGRTVASYSTLTSRFAAIAPDVGIYNVGYDLWLNGIPNDEVMIWTDNRNQVPAGSRFASGVSLSGYTWDVYATSGNGYIAFVPSNGARYTHGTIDIKAMLQYLVNRGRISANATVDQICYGVEIVSTGGSPATWYFTDFAITGS